MSAKRAFTRSKLPQNPQVTEAFEWLAMNVGLSSREGRAGLAAASAYARMAAEPDAEMVAALLLFPTGALPMEMGARVVSMSAGLRGFLEEGVVGLVRFDAAMADFILAGVIGACDIYCDEVNGRHPYMYEAMLARVLHKREVIDAAVAASQSPGLVIAAHGALDKFEAAMNARVEHARTITEFAQSGLPAHPLVEKAYNLMRDGMLRRHPHDAGAVAYGAQIAWEIYGGRDDYDPELVAAALLHEHVMDDPVAAAAALSPRVVELYVDAGKYGGRLRAQVEVDAKNAEASHMIRTAVVAVALNRALSVYPDTRLGLSMLERNALEAEIRRLSARLGSYAVDGKLPPLMEDRVDRLSRAARDMLATEAPPLRRPRAPKNAP